MNTGEILLLKFPHAIPNRDYIYGERDPGDAPAIIHWQVLNTNGDAVPFPDAATLATWEADVTAITADDVRAEAQRRIIAITGATDLQGCMIKQLNANMRANELNNKLATGGTLDSGEQAEAAALQALANAVKAIRTKSDVLESADPIPADYTDDSHWI